MQTTTLTSGQTKGLKLVLSVDILVTTQPQYISDKGWLKQGLCSLWCRQDGVIFVEHLCVRDENHKKLPSFVMTVYTFAFIYSTNVKIILNC